MAVFIKQASTYFTALYPEGTGRINIYCQDSYRIYLLFQTGALSSTSYNSRTKTMIGYVPIDRMSDYIDMLRNEKPVRVTFNEDTPSWVVHSNEPVGEGEINM